MDGCLVGVLMYLSVLLDEKLIDICPKRTETRAIRQLYVKKGVKIRTKSRYKLTYIYLH